MPVQPQHVSIASPFKLPLLAPLDFETKIGQAPDDEAPLDLSMKHNSSASALNASPLQSVKNEPEELEACGEAAEWQASRVCVKREASSAKTETGTEESV